MVRTPGQAYVLAPTKLQTDSTGFHPRVSNSLWLFYLTIHTIEPRDFCLFSALLTLRDDAKMLIVLSTSDIGTEENFKLAGDSKGYWHRRKATGRFLGVVGFLFGNPRRLFFYQKFGV